MKVKSLRYSIIRASIFLTAIGIACIGLPPSGVIIYAFDQNPAGLDEGNKWVTIHNPTNKSVDIGNWTLVQRLCIFCLLSLIVVSGKDEVIWDEAYITIT